MIEEFLFLRDKYHNITFYCHNLGGFDVVFLISILHTYNQKQSEEINKYKLRPILRDGIFIKLTIKKLNKSLIILESYCVLTSSLSQLAVDIQVETQKSIFP